jgi:hypothetical protein
MNIPTVPFPEDFTPHTEAQWTEFFLGPVPARTFCYQCRRLVKKDDFDPRAGMCGACINEAMAEAPEYFSNRGLVASAEEQEAHD